MILTNVKNNQNNQQYQDFQKKRERLSKLIQKQHAIAQALNLKNWEEVLIKLSDRVRSDNFKVLVLGEFKRGKSTLINALLGAEILPAYARPCTAIINEIKWGQNAKAFLHHAPTADKKARPPQEISVECLEEYVTIQNEDSDVNDEPAYEKVELFWPLELCRNGVEIVDSPGLNEHEIRQQVTLNYLLNADAILFVLSCETLCSQSELNAIDNTIRSLGHEDIFFACNRINTIRIKERESIKKHGITKLAPRTKRGAERVFFINALGALEGRIEEDKAALEKSGVVQLEEKLEDFLTTEKGKLKIIRPAIEIKNIIHETRRILPEREAMLRTDISILKKRYAAAQKPLRHLEILRQQIINKIVNFRLQQKQTIEQKVSDFYRTITNRSLGKYENIIYQWLQEYELKQPIKFFSKDVLPWEMSAAIERVVQELTEYISSKIENEITNWQKSQLQPFLSHQLEELTLDLDTRGKAFLAQVDELWLQVSGVSHAEANIHLNRVSPLSRILAAAGGYLLGDWISAGIGATLGLKEMLVNLMQQITLATVAVLLIGFNPLVLAPIMLSGGLVHALINVNATNDQIKKAIAQKYTEHLRGTISERADEIANAISDRLMQLQNAMDRGLGKEIQSVREQVNSIVAEKQKGQANVQQKLQQLATLSRSLDEIDRDLDDLIHEIALS
jgi:GTPase SAR1 family protein